MPRFDLSSPQPPSSTFGASPTPTTGGSTSISMPFGETSAEAPSSVRLSCLSPDGRAVHSFVLGSDGTASIETHSLPLEGTVQDDLLSAEGDNGTPSVIRTRLPAHVSVALRSYRALELLCVDKDASDIASTTTTTNPDRIYKLPKLCVYSKKEVFLLELGYRRVVGARLVEGTVLSVSEPFDSLLVGRPTSYTIVRIRQAPQSSHGYGVLCPSEAMALLLHDTDLNEYSLNLYHGTARSSPQVTTPLSHGIEQLDEHHEQFTDFCFLQSSAFPLLSSLSVALLKASGDVYQASPILFRGTVVPKESVRKTLDYLSIQFDHHGPTIAKGRQYKVAHQYLSDCFPSGENIRQSFLQAQERSVAFEWPAQLQGPILLAPESDDLETLATAVEPLLVGDFCGVAIGYLGYKIDFGLLAPTLLIPRFALEHMDDSQALDQALKWGAMVQRVDLRDDEDEGQPTTCSCLALVRDPIMETVVHYITPTAIQSISTNTLQVTANQLRNRVGFTGTAAATATAGVFSPPAKRKELLPRTTGWSCLNVSQLVPGGQGSTTTTHVEGAMVSGDVQFGHVLISRLSNGQMVAINLTEARQLQEMEGFGESHQLAIESQAVTSIRRDLAILQDTVPLSDVVKPLLEKLVTGLGGMGKIVGSATLPHQITPELLAAAAEVKEQCDNQVMLPILELSEQIRARKKAIAGLFNNQMEQLKSLRATVAKMKEKEASINEKISVVGANAESLAKRGASVLQSANDLLPTITQAEFDYFKELKRLQEKTKQWQEMLDRFKLREFTLQDSIEEGTNTGGGMKVPEQHIPEIQAMLNGSGKQIEKFCTRLQDTDNKLEELAAVAGIDINPYGFTGKRQ